MPSLRPHASVAAGHAGSTAWSRLPPADAPSSRQRARGFAVEVVADGVGGRGSMAPNRHGPRRERSALPAEIRGRPGHPGLRPGPADKDPAPPAKVDQAVVAAGAAGGGVVVHPQVALRHLRDPQGRRAE